MLVSGQLTVSSISRDAWVEIDLAKIESNVKTIRSWLADSTAFMAVVKADGYGHGATDVARSAVKAGATWLGVATVDEGLELRKADPSTPILILGPAPERAIKYCIEADLGLTITNIFDLAQTDAAANQLNRNAQVHLKIDTGMHRIGASIDQVTQLIDSIGTHKHLQLISIFSHLAKADEQEFTRKQDDALRSSLAKVQKHSPSLLMENGGPVMTHLASGDAARLHPFTHHDMVRVGLTMYGLASRTASDVVDPVMSVRGRINQIRDIPHGESIGYNLTWAAKTDARIASIPIGYADGVDRGLSNRMKGLLHGQVIPQAGLISMDQMLFDISTVPEAKLGDTITLIGNDCDKTIHLADWANMLDTITYELACRMRVRLPRIYTRGETIQV